MSELPEGWEVLKTKDTFNLVPTTGKNIKTKDAAVFGKYPVIDQGQQYICGYVDDEKKLIEIGHPVVIFGDHTRIYKWIDFNFVPGADGTKVLLPKKFLNALYFYHHLRSIELPDKGYARHFKFLKQSKFFLPPLNEQIRIANKLDSLLGKLEATQKRLDKIPSLLKRFRQSVLAAAVSGELTKEWRTQNKITLESWNKNNFDSVCREITVGFVGKMKDKYQESGVPFLRSQNVRAFKFSNKNLLYISEEFHQEINKSRLEAGDLAIVRSGAPGTTCVIPDSLGVANCSDLVIARPSDSLNADFACIFMNSEIGKSHVASNQVGVAQQHFNVGSMKKTVINLPSTEEQKEIAMSVNTFYELAEQAEQQHQAAKQCTDKLTQSILAKAFRGELVLQDPNDEPASELLARILTTHS